MSNKSYEITFTDQNKQVKYIIEASDGPDALKKCLLSMSYYDVDHFTVTIRKIN